MSQHLRQQGYRVETYQDFLLASKGGRAWYVNVRTKRNATYHRKTKRYEFGIPLVHFRRYSKLVQAGKTVVSIMREASTGAWYSALLTDLIPTSRTYQSDTVDKGGTVFVPKDKYMLMRQETPPE